MATDGASNLTGGKFGIKHRADIEFLRDASAAAEASADTTWLSDTHGHRRRSEIFICD